MKAIAKVVRYSMAICFLATASIGFMACSDDFEGVAPREFRKVNKTPAFESPQTHSSSDSSQHTKGVIEEIIVI